MSPVVRLTRLEITEYILRKRWLLAVLMALLVGSSETNRFVVQQMVLGYSYNIWDVLFSVFSNANYLLAVLNNLFLFLVSDFTRETGYGQCLLVKLGSRRKWWESKIALLAIAALVYTLINLSIVIGVASFSFPWQNSWSMGAQLSPQDSYLATEMLTMPPRIAFIKLLILLELGWFGLGLFTLTFSTLSRHSIVGFFAGVALNFSGLVIFKSVISPWITNLFFHQHMLLNLQYSNPANSQMGSYEFSLLYWICWIAFFSMAGWLLGRRENFFRGEFSH
jgi:hypothetical protein